MEIDNNGNATFTQIASSSGVVGSSETGILNINSEGVISDGDANSYWFMNVNKDVMYQFILLSDGEMSQEFSVFVKKAESYSQSDLAGTWYSAGIKTPQINTSAASDFGFDVDKMEIDNNGNATFTQIASSSGVVGSSETGILNINSEGVISDGDANCYWFMNVNKDVMYQFILLSDGEMSQEFSVFVKKQITQ